MATSVCFVLYRLCDGKAIYCVNVNDGNYKFRTELLGETHIVKTHKPLTIWKAVSHGAATDAVDMAKKYLGEHLTKVPDLGDDYYYGKAGVTTAALMTGVNDVCKSLKCTRVRITKAMLAADTDEPDDGDDASCDEEKEEPAKPAKSVKSVKSAKSAQPVD